MASMDVDTNVAMPREVYTIVMKFLADTPKNYNDSPIPGRHGDSRAKLHVRDYLNASTAASSPFRPGILAVATHFALRSLRRDVQHMNESLQHVDILESDQRPVMRVRELVWAYQVLADLPTPLPLGRVAQTRASLHF